MPPLPGPALPLTGGCQCGAVRYALHAPPEGAHICHCRMCQKAVGGPFAALAPVRLREFAWTRGEPAIFESSDLATRQFCAICGTPLSFAYRHKPWIDITIGSLDRPALVPPVRQYGIESQQPWCCAAMHDLPAQPIALTIEGEAVKPASRQHPDHDTPEHDGFR